MSGGGLVWHIVSVVHQRNYNYTHSHVTYMPQRPTTRSSSITIHHHSSSSSSSSSIIYSAPVTKVKNRPLEHYTYCQLHKVLELTTEAINSDSFALFSVYVTRKDIIHCSLTSRVRSCVQPSCHAVYLSLIKQTHGRIAVSYTHLTLPTIYSV